MVKQIRITPTDACGIGSRGEANRYPSIFHRDAIDALVHGTPIQSRSSVVLDGFRRGLFMLRGVSHWNSPSCL